MMMTNLRFDDRRGRLVGASHRGARATTHLPSLSTRRRDPTLGERSGSPGTERTLSERSRRSMGRDWWSRCRSGLRSRSRATLSRRSRSAVGSAITLRGVPSPAPSRGSQPLPSRRPSAAASPSRATAAGGKNGLAFGALGAATGALIGWTIKTDKWERVGGRQPELRISMPKGGLGAQLKVKW